MEKQLIKCSKIGVDCVPNDPVDVRCCSGPVYLGFDFNVLEDKTDKMKEFIRLSLKSFEIPFVGFTTESVEVEEKNVWDEDRIYDCIQEQSTYLLEQAERNYPVASPRK